MQTHLKKLTQVVSKAYFVKQSLKIIKYDFTLQIIKICEINHNLPVNWKEGSKIIT